MTTRRRFPIATFATFARIAPIALGALLAAFQASAMAATPLTITVSHDLDAARPSETITVAWSDVNRALPGALVQRIAVKDAAGRVLPHQVTNVAPQAKDPQGVGAAYGELIFQHSFAKGEKRARFIVEKIDKVAPPFPAKVFARQVPERLDDFAWENDKVAHRTYGPALGAPAEPGSGKEVLVTSGLDIWFKRVSYPIIDRWYNKGHDHYHKDQGEGMDMYNVGKTRGNGGTGVWDGKALFTGRNYATSKVLANGPIRAVFELTYEAWDAPGTAVSEVKRFTVDAGHQFDRVDSTFTFSGPATLTVAAGLNKTPSDKNQAAPRISVTRNQAATALIQWVEQADNGAFGAAIILPGADAFGEDALNYLIMAPVASGKPLRYYVGAAWNRAGDIANQAAWERYTAALAARVNNPVRVVLSAQP